MRFERAKLTQGDLVLLVSVLLGEERLHVLDEGARDGGREIEGLADHALAPYAPDRLRSALNRALPTGCAMTGTPLQVTVLALQLVRRETGKE